MARTSKSRGMKPFKMRSPETPYPFLKGLGKGLKSLVNKTPIGMIGNALKGGGGGDAGGADDVNAKIDEIHEALVGGGGGGIGSGTGEAQTLAKAAKDGALTKKAGPLFHNEHKGQSDPKHELHTHHPKSPNHPDNQPKFKVDGKEVSFDEFAQTDGGLEKDETGKWVPKRRPKT
mgnify:CR=1 FL=1|jgi:hypothetical protein